MSIYKPCDIRGDAAEELTPEMYYRWGYALGMQVEPEREIRRRGRYPPLHARFPRGAGRRLAQAGVDTIDLGQLPTPMIYHAKRRLKAAACAIVTASHNPVFVNGLKWMIGDRPPAPGDVEAMRRSAEKASSQNHRTPRPPRSMDISFDYVANLQETWLEAMNAQLHVVIDPMYGCWAGKCRRYLHAIFPQCLFSTIHDTPEEDFAGQIARLLPALAACTSWARPSIANGRHWGWLSTATATAWPWSMSNGSPLSGEETAWILWTPSAKSFAASVSSTI